MSPRSEQEPHLSEMTRKQESALSTLFHIAMLHELETHHDEKSTDWSQVDPEAMTTQALQQILKYMINHNSRHLVHAANYLTIAWAISTQKERSSGKT